LEIKKKVLLDALPGLYAVGGVEVGGKLYYAASSENRQGEMFLVDSETDQVFPLPGSPGGVMSLVDAAGEDAMFSIEEFYPVFDSAQAKIVKIGLKREGDRVEVTRRVLTDAPYVHRISQLQEEDGTFLAAGILCRHKDFQDDWSQAGSMQIGRYSPDADHVQLETVYEGVFKHHAMFVRKNQAGYDDLYFGGTEGCFRTVRRDGQWVTERILDVPTSDIVVWDLDGDGVDELAIIEQFHGDNAAVFRKTADGYVRQLDLPLTFGHVLWGGEFLGRPGLIAGSRGGDKSMYLYRLGRDGGGALTVEQKTELDAGQAAAQIVAVSGPDRARVVAANHGAGQLVRYDIR